MEKRLRKISYKNNFYNTKNLISIFLILFLACNLAAQNVSQITKIRFPLWADLDAYPGSEEARNDNGNPSKYDYPIGKIKELAPFLVEGMVYGWSFTYRPYDKTRGVNEEMEITPLVNPCYVAKNIVYSSPWLEDNTFNCWVQYNKSEYEMQEYDKWSVINNPVIHGIGYGSFEKGFEGIKDACKDGLKNAVRNYYRNIIKNKPKEIRGKVLIKDVPLIGVDAGQYMINLDFFLECSKIIEYKVF